MFEVDPGPGAEAAQGHVAAQGAGPGLGLEAALECWSPGLLRLVTVTIHHPRLLVTCLVTGGALQRGEVLRLGCGRGGVGRGRPLFEAQLLQQDYQFSFKVLQ